MEPRKQNKNTNQQNNKRKTRIEDFFTNNPEATVATTSKSTDDCSRTSSKIKSNNKSASASTETRTKQSNNSKTSNKAPIQMQI